MSLRQLARVCGYGSNHMRVQPLFACKQKANTIDHLVNNPTFRGVQSTRRDKFMDDPIWCQCWHEFTSVKKGQQYRCKIVKTERVKVGEGKEAKWVQQTQWLRHQKRFMAYKMKQFRQKVIAWPPYQLWRSSYLARNPRLPNNWEVSEEMLYKVKCFCVDKEEVVRKCGCETHLKMSELLAGLKRWRQKILKEAKKAGHSCDVCSSDQYISVCDNVSTIGAHLCPCPRQRNGERQLQCVQGSCEVCEDVSEMLRVCSYEKEHFTSEVKYKWLRPIKIGNRNETVWAYDTKPYHEFTDLFCTYFSKYRLHNWVYKRQQQARLNARQNLQPGDVIFEFDYAAKATQFQQDCMPSSAARQTSKFILFVHFDPKLDEVGHNVTDTTEVFAFHSNCLTQDSQSIRRCLTHVVQNLKARGHLRKNAHFFADGSGTQNKGRKAFRNLSELSHQEAIDIIQNFACTSHFGGPWDTEGGRQTRAITQHILNARDDESILDAGDNVRLLRRIMNKAGEPDAPIPSQKMWRPPVVYTPTSATVTPTTSSTTTKPKRQARGRTEQQMFDDDTDPHYVISRRHILRIEPCDCKRSCSCPSDGRLTYVRDEKYDCTRVKGTLSTYCYRFRKRALHLDVRQFSCYCRWCSRGQYRKCSNLAVVRHDPSNPLRPFDEGYRQWNEEGWRHVVQTAKSAPDKAVTRTSDQSIESACDFISSLPFGSTIAVRTKVEGRSTFWLASKQSEVKKATRTDDNTGIKKGEKILNILWYDRLGDYKYIKLDELTHISVVSVIVTKSKVAWKRTTTNRYYLGEHTHSVIQRLVNNLSEL